MLSLKTTLVTCVLIVAGTTAAGCGSTSNSKSSAGSPGGSNSGGAAAGSSAGALSADARSAATGDIPDNQVFLVFNNKQAGYSIKYPEGWTQRGSARSVTFQDKNNLVHVQITAGAAPTPQSVDAQLNSLKHSNGTLNFRAPQPVQLPSGPAIKVVYTTESAPNPVTGKRVLLIVDRYELARAGRVATVDLGTPRGVDNVDAYRMMIDSFRWR